MRIPKSVPLALVIALGAIACGDDSASQPSAVLEGTWRASKAEFTSVAAPPRTVDVVAQGATVTLVLATGGAFTFTIAAPGQPTDVRTGTWSASVDELTLTISATNVMQFDFTLTGTNLTMTGGHSPFDFNSGVMEEAILSMTLTK